MDALPQATNQSGSSKRPSPPITPNRGDADSEIQARQNSGRVGVSDSDFANLDGPPPPVEPWFLLGAGATKLTLLRLIANDPTLSQHQLCSALGLSLGTINVYVKQMLAVGWLRVEGSNHKLLRYFVTPRGLSQSHELWRRHAWEVSRLVDELESDIAATLTQWHNGGVRRIGVVACPAAIGWITAAAAIVPLEIAIALTPDSLGPETNAATIEQLGRLGRLKLEALLIADFAGVDWCVQRLAPLAEAHGWALYRL